MSTLNQMVNSQVNHLVKLVQRALSLFMDILRDGCSPCLMYIF